jgi:putative transposase
MREEFYTEKALLDGETEKDLLVILIKRGDELAGIGSWEREQDALAIYARFGAIAPQHRGAKLAVRAMEFGEAIARTMGAGFIYGRANNLEPSMSRRGNCWDNAVAESFFSSLKKERVRQRVYKTRELARADIFDYIEVFYNRTRRHSHLGGVSPEAFERASI